MTSEALKSLMLAHGMTVTELASIVGMSRRSIEHYRSERLPVPKWLDLILSAIDANAIDLEWMARHIDFQNAQKGP